MKAPLNYVVKFVDILNIILSVPEDVLRQAKILDVKRVRSATDLLTHMVEDIASRVEVHDTASRRHMYFLDAGVDLGTKGSPQRTREEINER